MASTIEAANTALSKLGSATITSLTDNTKAARAISRRFDAVRRAELRRHRWTFAIVRAALPAMTTAPSWGYSLQYQLPADLLRLDQVSEFWYVTNLVDYVNGEMKFFEVEGGKILTDLPAPLNIRYSTDVVDPNKWDAAFYEMFASRLAYEICEELTQSSTKKQDLIADYKTSRSEAIAANAIERPPTMLPDDSWVFSRL